MKTCKQKTGIRCFEYNSSSGTDKQLINQKQKNYKKYCR